MYFYKAIKNDTSEIIGVAASESPLSDDEKNDTLHNVSYVEITYEEYLKLN